MPANCWATAVRYGNAGWLCCGRHQGFFNESYTPVGRGFDSFFGFYDGGQSYYTHITPCVTATPYIITQRHTHDQKPMGWYLTCGLTVCGRYGVWRDPATPLFWTPSNFGGQGKGGNVTYPLMHTTDHCGALVDLANDTLDAASGKVILRHADVSCNGTHSTELLATQVVHDINRHDSSRPLFVCETQAGNLCRCFLPIAHQTDTVGTLICFFMYEVDLAWHAVHDPLEVGPEYTALYEGKIEDTSRRVLAGMISNLDEGVANITSALKQKGMWQNTLWIMTTDNGAGHPPNTRTAVQFRGLDL